MDRLRAFWARSLLNKAIVGLVVFTCVCGCIPGVILGPRNASAPAASGPAPTVTQELAAVPTEAVAPTEAPEPTEEPEPTEAPTEAPTLAEEPAAEEPASGLGVTAAELEDPFTRAGFRFSDSPLNDGRPRRLGTGPSQVGVELIGSPDDLGKVTVLGPFPAGEAGAQTRQLSAVSITGVVQAIAPEHLEEISAWVGEQITRASQGEAVTAEQLTTGPVTSQMTILVANDGALVTYSIEPAQP